MPSIERPETISPETLVVVEAASVVARRKAPAMATKSDPMIARGGALLASGDFLRRDPRQNDEQKALSDGYEPGEEVVRTEGAERVNVEEDAHG